MIPVPITARSGFHDKLSKSLLQVAGMMYNGMDDSASPSSEKDDVLRSVMVWTLRRCGISLKTYFRSLDRKSRTCLRTFWLLWISILVSGWCLWPLLWIYWTPECLTNFTFCRSYPSATYRKIVELQWDILFYYLLVLMENSYQILELT